MTGPDTGTRAPSPEQKTIQKLAPIQKLAILKLQSVQIQKLTRFRNYRVSRFRNSLNSETIRFGNWGVGGWGGDLMKCLC